MTLLLVVLNFVIDSCITSVQMFHNPQYPMKYECFDSLSLTLPPEATQVYVPSLAKPNQYYCTLSVLPQVTLHSRLLEFTKPEIVHDVECPQCSKVR